MITFGIDARMSTRFVPGRVITIDEFHKGGRCVNCRRRGRLYSGHGPNTGSTRALVWVHVDTDTHLCNGQSTEGELG